MVQIPFSVLAANSSDVENQKLEYNDTIIEVDSPVSLDAYLICYNKSGDELWHLKLYSYDYISGVSMEAQKVSVSSLSVDDDKIKVIDSRNVIYYIDPLDGKLLSKDDSEYFLPDFSDVNFSENIANNSGIFKYLAIFAAFVGVGIIVFIASRNKK